MKKFNIVIFVIIVLSSINLYSQFGKNKVQYREYDWKFIQSKHFDIFYDNGNKYLAEFTAYSAERALEAIQKDVGFKLSIRVSLVIYESHNDFQQTNVISQFMPEGVGGVTELFKNRVVVPFQGDYAVFDHVIHHELVHAVFNDMFYGGTFQTAISTSNGFMIPLWLNEGMAEYSSLYGYNTQTDMYMRDIAISEKLPSLNQMGGYMAYRGGQTFYWYVSKEYGKQKVPEFVNKLLITRDVDRAFELSFGMDLKKFSKKWEAVIKKMYWPDVEIFQALTDFSIRVTDRDEERNFYNSSPSISPNGEKMAYISAPGGMFSIAIRDIDDPDTERKLVSSFRKQDFEDLNILTPGISWNPQGDKLAISAKSGGHDEIFIVDEKTGKYDKLNIGLRSISSVAWSPDGKKLAFIGNVVEKSDIFIYDIDSKTWQNFTEDIFTDANPVWSPDSKSIYFISDREGNEKVGMSGLFYKMWNHDVYASDVFKMDLETKKVKRLTFDPQNKKTSLAVLPDNSGILYVSDKNGIGNVYKLNNDDLVSKPITNSLNGISQISLANDGSKLLFSTQIDGGYDIFMIRFPLDIDLAIDELPLTKFKEQKFEKEDQINNILAAAKKEKVKQEELISYGDYELDFSQQEVLKPNPEVKREDPSLELTSDQSKSSAPSPTVEKIDGEFVEKDYKVKFSPDIVAGNPGFSTWFGVQGATQMLFSDELGDHQIYVQAFVNRDIANSQMMIAYNHMPKIIDYSLSAYHYAVFVNEFDDNTGFFNTYRFRNFATNWKAQRPFSLFNRVEAGVDLMYLSKENISFAGVNNNSKYLIVPEIRYVFDNTLNGYYGPRQGARYYVGARHSPQLGANGVGFTTMMSDIRFYQSFLGGFYTFAVRGTGSASFGPNPQKFFLGGMDNWINRRFSNGELPFNEPEDFAYLNFQTPMRGWAVGEATGSKFALFNAELRFPIFAALSAGPLPILLQGVMGNLFVDVGAAWDNDFNPVIPNELRPTQDNVVPEGSSVNDMQNLMLSTGTGLRSYLLGLPVKMDVAWRKIGNNWSRPLYLFSIGFDF